MRGRWCPFGRNEASVLCFDMPFLGVSLLSIEYAVNPTRKQGKEPTKLATALPCFSSKMHPENPVKILRLH